MKRSTVKRMMPNLVKQALKKVRDGLNGPGIEHDMLRDNVFVPDMSPVPRISLILPSLSSQAAFGGVTTGINFFVGLAKPLKAAGFDLRILSEQAIDPADNVLGKYPDLAGCETLALRTTGCQLPTRSKDIFVAYNWWISLNLEPALAKQAEYFDQDPLPKLHIIQEYEPHFYPFSAAHLLAREAMGECWPLWAVFNTHELYDFWKTQGHVAQRSYVFEPRMNAAIRPFANELTSEEKTRTVLVYGRPQIPRNAFFLIQRGLGFWAQHYGAAHSSWRIVSAGMAHEDIDLGAGHQLKSLGKLSLQDYGVLLRETSIGLSLMSSPHPSYPPLEMAHFGARVLTNAYANKHPSERHENLVTLPSIRPEAIGKALQSEVTLFEEDPGAGLQGKSHMGDYLDSDQISCVGAVASDILSLLRHKQSP